MKTLDEITNAQEIESLTLSDLVKSVHIIVGYNGRCMCGIYDGKAFGCSDILASKSEDIQKALIMANCGGERICPTA